ncbi:MAG: cytochrome c [Pirellulaceae bacterium]
MKRISYLALIQILFGAACAWSQESATATTKTNRTAAVTFSSDIATIIYDKCSSCHRPGQVGPFPLLTFDDVKKRASTIEAVIENDYMPPWKPVNHNVQFSNDRSLSKSQKEKLRQWIAADCPEGDRVAMPTPPEFPDGWSLGKPDLIVKMNGQFEIPADGPDIYRSFVFPLQLPEDKWVKAIELRSSAKSAMHHALFFLDLSGNARKMDGSDGKAGISGMGFLADFGGAAGGNQTGGGGLLSRLGGQRNQRGTSAMEDGRIDGALARGLGGYVPGAMPTKLPGDLAMALPKGSDIVMQTHFHPSGKRETEQAEMALYFADRPPSKQLVPIQVPAMFGFGANIDIPAGEKNFRVTDSFTLPIDVKAISVGGHAHYICREMKMIARTPTGTEITLMQIDDWDLDWQDRYLYAEPVFLPAGTVITTDIVYDNSADNPENPYQPPQGIRWGRQSNDEMGSVTLAVVAADESQRPDLQVALRTHFTSSIADRFTKGKETGQMLLQLDENRDGKLQKSEAPPRLSGRVFEMLDQDSDGALDAAELGRLRELIEKFGLGKDK